MTTQIKNLSSLLPIYFFIFFLSGFSGLIYESIWSRYLKLFLGSASYAQMLVLIIFMGGMAIGSALSAKYSFKFRNLILMYGICEVIIGIFGIGFHGIFTSTVDIFFSSIAPSLNSANTINTVKFSLAAFIIMPQSILLGATFPFITAGLLRKYPDKSGNKISTLYFLNSFGAALGVLFSAFVLVPSVGLPGTALTSGLINISLGLLVYLLSKGDNFVVEPKKLISSTSSQNVNLFLGIAFITGLASFMYEIAWIRMLSMVFGASTDAFEIMLSTFIFGLAIGSLLIRRYIDGFGKPILVLGFIQVIMGSLAMMTILMYNELFDYLAFVKRVVMPTDDGYVLYNIATFALSAVIMLPATICAGTTLPLITNILLKKYNNESAIGSVYGFNTLGAILGVLLTVQLVMPTFGLKSVIMTGGMLDILVGLILIFYFNPFNVRNTIVPVFSIIAISIASFTTLDIYKMSSAVFRDGLLWTKDDMTPIYHADGKITTVAVIDYLNSDKQPTHRTITNNGKPDAGISLIENEAATDEPTMSFLGILPFLYNDNDDVEVANIGFGSGLTAETVLANPNVKSLDTIEIEEKVIEAGKYFAPKVGEVYTDPRSNIIIDDAKTVFASQKKKYDVIIAEPPNPWVSGVSSLFTIEWYSFIKNYLKDDGIYTQWVQGYEINDDLVALIYASLRKEFDYVAVFNIGASSDIAIIASQQPLAVSNKPFLQNSKTQEILQRLKVNTFDDVYTLRYLGDQRVFDAYLNYRGKNNSIVNSDYFPILDNLAAKSRFRKDTLSSSFMNLNRSRAIHTVNNGSYYVDNPSFDYTKEDNDIRIQSSLVSVKDFYDFVMLKKPIRNKNIEHDGMVFLYSIEQCKTEDGYIDKPLALIEGVFDFLDKTKSKELLSLLNDCQGMTDEQIFKVKTLENFLSGEYSQIVDDASVINEKLDLIENNNDFYFKLVVASALVENQRLDGKLFKNIQMSSDNELKVLYRILISRDLIR